MGVLDSIKGWFERNSEKAFAIGVGVFQGVTTGNWSQAFLAASLSYGVTKYTKNEQAKQIRDAQLRAAREEAKKRNQQVVSALAPRRNVYGVCKVGGVVAFLEVDSATEQELYGIIILATHSIHRVLKVSAGDDDIVFSDNPNTNFGEMAGKWSFNDESGYSTFNGMQFFNITGTTGIPSWITSATSLTSDDDFDGMACCAFKIRYSTKQWPSGIPNFEFLIEGKQGTVASLSTVTNKEYSSEVSGTISNPADIFYDYMKDTVVGMAMPNSALDAEKIKAAGTICDGYVQNKNDTDGKTFTINYMGNASSLVPNQYASTPSVDPSDGNNNIFIHTGDILQFTVGGVSANYYVTLADGTLFFNENNDGGLSFINGLTQFYYLSTSFTNFVNKTYVGDVFSGAGSITSVRLFDSRYRMATTVNADETHLNNVENILKGCLGSLNYEGGRFSLTPASWITSVGEIKQEDIIGDIAISPKYPRDSRFNTTKGTFIGPETVYVESDFPQNTITGLVTQDGQEMVEDFAYTMVDNSYQCQRMARIELLRMRNEIRFQVQLGIEYFKYSVGDRLKVDLPLFGIGERQISVGTTSGLESGQVLEQSVDSLQIVVGEVVNSTTFQILEFLPSGTANRPVAGRTLTRISPTGLASFSTSITTIGSIFYVRIGQIDLLFEPETGIKVALQVVEDNESTYDFATSDLKDIDISTDSTMPIIRSAVAPTNLAATAIQTLQHDGTVTSTLRITWTKSTSSFIQRYIIGLERSSDSGSTYQLANEIIVDYTNNTCEFTGLETTAVSDLYRVGIRSQTYEGVRSDIVYTGNIVLPGDSTAPSVPTFVRGVPGNNQIAVELTLPSETDTIGAGIFASTTNSTPASSQAELVFIGGKPLETVSYTLDNISGTNLTNGTTYYIWARSIDTSGNKGTYTAMGSGFSPAANTGPGAGIQEIAAADGTTKTPNSAGTVTIGNAGMVDAVTGSGSNPTITTDSVIKGNLTANAAQGHGFQAQTNFLDNWKWNTSGADMWLGDMTKFTGAQFDANDFITVDWKLKYTPAVSWNGSTSALLNTDELNAPFIHVLKARVDFFNSDDSAASIADSIQGTSISGSNEWSNTFFSHPILGTDDTGGFNRSTQCLMGSFMFNPTSAYSNMKIQIRLKANAYAAYTATASNVLIATADDSSLHSTSVTLGVGFHNLHGIASFIRNDPTTDSTNNSRTILIRESNGTALGGASITLSTNYFGRTGASGHGYHGIGNSTSKDVRFYVTTAGTYTIEFGAATGSFSVATATAWLTREVVSAGGGGSLLSFDGTANTFNPSDSPSTQYGRCLISEAYLNYKDFYS